MKVRKLAVALALAGGLGSGVAQALGLGEIELQSYLNEPLEADIGLTRSGGVSPSDVFVNLASEGAYRQVGIDRSYFLNKLKFDVTTAADGNLVVNVSTTEPVREPYLNFLLEVTWPSGRLMREYAVLIDPPVYAEDSGLTQQVQAPVVAPAPAPAPRQTVSAAPRVEAAPASSSGTGSPATFGPTGPADTLWAIASAVKPNSSVSNQQVMLAIQDLNPDAFIGGNINRLKRGQVLRIPTLEQVQQRSRAQATQEVSLQNEALAAPVARTVDAREETPEVAAEQTAPQVAAAVETGGDELKLMVADTTMDPAENDSGSAGGESTMSGGVASGSSVVMEELDSTRRENEELSGRVEDLQAQVETLQRLLELKNTQLAEAKEQADAANRAKTEFLANMSHELRTPLNAINGFSEIMAGEMFGPLGDARYKGYAADILKSGQHLLSLINDILDMAKIEAGKLTLHYEAVSLKEIVEDAARLMRGRVEESGLKLLVDAPDLPTIEADHRGLKQVVLNLLSNAVKFTPEGGDIVIALSREDDDRVRVAVTDTGIGIAAEDLGRLARPFEQVEGQHSKTTQGTGLGLALTKSLIELHGGTLTLESEPGCGTTVSFDLPIRRPEQATQSQARAA